MKKFLICKTSLLLNVLMIFLAIAGSRVMAQGISWEGNYGGSNNDQPNAIQSTQDDGYIVAGYSNSKDGDVSDSNGTYDYWIVKLTNNGGIEWEQNYGGGDNDIANAVQPAPDGGYIIAGNSNSPDGDISVNNGGHDYWVVKIDSNSNILWERSYGGSGADIANAVQVTPDEGYIIAGNSNSTDGDVSGDDGSDDIWVVKTDSTGNIEWDQSYGGSATDEVNAIELTPDGGYVIAGTSESSDSIVSGNNGNTDYWVIKTDSNGNVEWNRNYGGEGYEYAQSVLPVSNGKGYMVAGYANSTDSLEGDVSDNYGDHDFWIVRLDSSGNIEWEQNYGGTGADHAVSIKPGSDENSYVVSGYSNSADGDISASIGGYDYWMIKIDSSGSIQWRRSLGGSQNDIATSFLSLGNERYVIAGYSSSSDGDVSANKGDTDYWIAALCPYTHSSISPFACSSYTVPSEDTSYTSSGTYYDTIPNTAGCDSIITIELTIPEAIVNKSGDSLYTNEPGSYQWLNCDSGYAEMQDDTNASLVPEQEGSYALELRNNDCIDTSDCYQVVISGRQEDDFGSAFRVHPNPTDGRIHIKLGAVYDNVNVRVINNAGQTISMHQSDNTDHLNFNIEGASGLYLLRIKSGTGKTENIRIMKE